MALNISNIWDQSVEEWDRFELNYPVYSNVMKSLCEFGEISREHNVLDLGCGTGRSSLRLAGYIPDGSLTVLDSSPQMVRKAEELLSGNSRVSLVVADARMPPYGVVNRMKFDRIVVHFSFPGVVDNESSTESFACNWKYSLKQDGEMLIAIHNSFIECDTPTGFEGWSDPLRSELRRAAQAVGVDSYIREDVRYKFTVDEIVNGFRDGGFHLKKIDTKVFERSMRDRIAMWKVPAVLNSFLDVREVDNQKMDQLLSIVSKGVKGMDTMPTIVVFFRFCLQ